MNETIAAIATAAGDAAIAVIRLSGKDALEIADQIFSGSVKKFTSHTAHYGKILEKDGSTLDHVLLLVMHAPRTYTGENTVEIFCHGGHVLTQKVLKRVLEEGADAAKAGEFTLRAFKNNKIDLAQAEAVQKLICAQNDLALSAAENHLEGALSQKIKFFQKDLTEIAAILEAWIDFPEEDLEFDTTESVIQKIQFIVTEMQKLSKTFHDGKIISHGIRVCLLGAPNVGKSSLMNALLGKERAIVTKIAGTTRDVLEEDIKIGLFHFCLIDTAGIRKTDEHIEKIGVERSKKMMEQADLILHVLDASTPLSLEDHHLIKLSSSKKTLYIWNKIDIQKPSKHFSPSIAVSAKKKLHIDELKNKLQQMIWQKGPPSKDQIIITELRHKKALDQAIACCQKVIEGLKSNTSAEFVSQDMFDTLRFLSEIIGTNVTEDVLSAIFSKFCIGK